MIHKAFGDTFATCKIPLSAVDEMSDIICERNNIQ